MKKFFALILLGLFSCAGYSDLDNTYQDQDSLQEETNPYNLIMNREEDIPTYGSLAEAQSAGVAVVEPGAEMCQGRIGPGQICFIPVNLNIFQWDYLFTDGGPIWFDAINAERNSIKDRLNGFGWNFNIATTNAQVNWWTVLGTTHPTIPGRVGETVYWVHAYVTSEQGGTYAFHYMCRSTLYKNTILNLAAWKAGNETSRTFYVQNIFDHEMMHCAGPPHINTVGDLMSSNAGGWPSSNLNPNSTHMTWLDNYNP